MPGGSCHVGSKEDGVVCWGGFEFGGDDAEDSSEAAMLRGEKEWRVEVR